jgi:hypothetical protein
MKKLLPLALFAAGLSGCASTGMVPATETGKPYIQLRPSIPDEQPYYAENRGTAAALTASALSYVGYDNFVAAVVQDSNITASSSYFEGMLRPASNREDREALWQVWKDADISPRDHRITRREALGLTKRIHRDIIDDLLDRQRIDSPSE